MKRITFARVEELKKKLKKPVFREGMDDLQINSYHWLLRRYEEELAFLDYVQTLPVEVEDNDKLIEYRSFYILDEKARELLDEL